MLFGCQRAEVATTSVESAPATAQAPSVAAQAGKAAVPPATGTTTGAAGTAGDAMPAAVRGTPSAAGTSGAGPARPSNAGAVAVAGAGGGGGSAGAERSAAGSSGTAAVGGMDDVVPSEGCGKPLGTLRSGKHMIDSSNMPREFTLDVPVDYQPDTPYRLVFAWHWINASDDAVVNGEVAQGGAAWAYYGLKRQSEMTAQPAIFIAPQSRNGRWDEQDHTLFDELLALAERELCIDTRRVFATGFSFGAMHSYSLSTSHQKQLRAVSLLAPANFNIYLPTNTHEPIAYMSATGMSDTRCPWDEGNGRGALPAALERAKDNGCAVPSTVPTTMSGSKSHMCFDFKGCQQGFPVKACTFDGGHIAAHADGGTGDNGMTSWMPEVTWKFFTQF